MYIYVCLLIEWVIRQCIYREESEAIASFNDASEEDGRNCYLTRHTYC